MNEKILNKMSRILAVLVGVVVASIYTFPTAVISAADNNSDCLYTAEGTSVTLNWGDGGGSHVVRRNGSWLATPGSGTSSFTDPNSPDGATYEIRTWANGDRIDRLCEADPVDPVDPVDPPAEGCLYVRNGSEVSLSWFDNGGSHVIRRNGNWLATPGDNVSTYTDTNSPDGSTYELRTRLSGVRTDTACTEAGDPVDPVDPLDPIDPVDPVDPVDPPVDGCTVTRSGNNNVISWLDEGGNHVIRRNGDWLVTPGENVSTYTDINGSPLAEYELRIWLDGIRTDTICTSEPVGPVDPVDPTPLPEANAEAERVVHVGFDGLRSDHVTAQLMPNLWGLMQNGSSTLNARTDPSFTQTLPNHTSQFTGRSVYGNSGHQVDFNNFTFTTVHEEAGTYISSVYDVVHDNGGNTILIAGKSKFDMMMANWNLNGAIDTTGVDNGTQKIDYYDRDAPQNAITAFADFMGNTVVPAYGFYHIRTPDSGGHEFTWASSEYAASVTAADTILGQLLSELDARGVLATTTIIVTADHGGPTGGDLHNNPTVEKNYTVPFVVSGLGATPGADLYLLNSDDRNDPGTAQIQNDEANQPIRTGEVANLVLDILGLPSVPGSNLNNDQSLDF